jgi:hypothetical protein
MNEKPDLEPGFFCWTICWRLDGLRVSQRSRANYPQIADKLRPSGRSPDEPTGRANARPMTGSAMPGVM